MSDDPSAQGKDTAAELELIERAEAGDATAGRELLRAISLGLTRGDLHPALARFHADCLWNHVQLGISLERALYVYRYQVKAMAHDPVELAAVFELLVEFAGMKKGAAKSWIKTNIGASKQTTESAHAAVNLKALNTIDDSVVGQADSSDAERDRRARYLDLLLHTAGSMRILVSEVVSLK